MKLTYKHTKYAAYIGYITQAIVVNLAPLLFATFNTSYGISLGKIGLLVSINFGTQIIVDFISVRYIDKIGYRLGAIIAHIFAVTGLICMGLMPGAVSNPYAALVFSTVLLAIGGGLTEVLISPIVESLPGDEKESAMSMLHSFYSWGQVVVVLLSTLYFTTIGIENWKWLPVIWAIVPLFNIFFFAKVPLKVLVEDSQRVPVRKIFTSGLFWLFLALMVCSGASEQAMSQWASLFAERGLKVAKTMGDLLGPCMFAAFMGLSRLMYGLFGSKLNVKNGLIASGVMCVVSYVITVFAPYPILSLAGCALCGFSVGLMWPGTLSLAAKDFSSSGTAVFALLALAGDLGCSAGPGLVGAISNWVEKSGVQADALKTGIGVGMVFPIALVIVILAISKMAVSKRETGAR